MTKSKDPVKLRKRPRTNGGYSLNLDINVNGRRKVETLKLYLVPENSRADKIKNQRIVRLATKTFCGGRSCFRV